MDCLTCQISERSTILSDGIIQVRRSFGISRRRFVCSTSRSEIRSFLVAWVSEGWGCGWIGSLLSEWRWWRARWSLLVWVIRCVQQRNCHWTNRFHWLDLDSSSSSSSAISVHLNRFDLVLYGDYSEELLSRTGQSRSGLDRSPKDHPHCPSPFHPSNCTTKELADRLSFIHSIRPSDVPKVLCNSLVFLSFANLIMQSMYLSFFYDFSNSSPDFISDVDDRPNESPETDRNGPMGISSTSSCSVILVPDPMPYNTAIGRKRFPYQHRTQFEVTHDEVYTKDMHLETWEERRQGE